MNYNKLLSISVYASLKAGDAILDIYDSDFSIETKADNSPLTRADQKSHDIICDMLDELGFPILSEEGKETDYAVRRNWERLWIVDPLDGTKEFIKRNGEFTINIALVESGKPVLGVIFIPVKQLLYFALKGLGAFKLSDSIVIEELKKWPYPEDKDGLFKKIVEHSVRLPVSQSGDGTCVIIGSRSHGTEEVEAFVKEKQRTYDSVDFISAGSSLKFCLVAEGKADIYPRFGPTMEWDTAAGQAIAENAGARIFDKHTGLPLQYNKENLLNPHFIVQY